MIGLGFVVAGVTLLALGGWLLAGPVALMVAGAVLVLVGLVVPWEEVTRESSSPAPSVRRRR